MSFLCIYCGYILASLLYFHLTKLQCYTPLSNLKHIFQAILKSKNSAEAYMQNIISSTRGIVFMGTPHCGSSLAQWASLCGNFTNLLRRTNKNILAILEPDSEVLASIQEEFHTMLRARTDQGKPAIKLMCFVEELPVVGVGMVRNLLLLYVGIAKSA